MHKYNKDYDTMFAVLAQLSQEIMSQPPNQITDSDIITLRSLIHHSQNSRYAYDARQAAQEYKDILVDAKATVSRMSDPNKRRLVDGPTWWQTLQDKIPKHHVL